MNLTLDSSLLLIPIETRKDKKNYILEDKVSGEFYEMPKLCIDAIQLIVSGETLGEIEKQLKEKYPEEEIDLLDFARQLFELNLIAEIDGIKVEVEGKNKERLGFLWISPKVGKFFFNKIAIFVYLILLIVNVSLLVSHPLLFPNYKDLFIFDLMILNIPTWLVLSFFLVLIHEFGHILAMRAQNLPTKLEIGHRLILVVLETDMSAVWKLSSAKRNVLFFAGICFDTVILFAALISQLVFANSSSILLGIMNVVVLDTFIRIVYQCCIYMKTDLYYVFENVSGCYNLMENAQQVLRRWFPFLATKATEEVVFEGERKTVFVYALFYFVGVFLFLGLFVFYYIPQLLFAFKKILPGFTEGLHSLSFWDATLFSLQILISVALLLYSWRKKYVYH